ncbi:uncharacterized protein LOC114939395 [Nylanderia fulva]|uniref:uncharacterized protein LOC114939395 n=1 Tax=Nylanderia fulva TaxID=613905 RepID=UPI0010FAFC2E|nr:uncharacterized protein LOC114939395 [Nylanderia fulva]
MSRQVPSFILLRIPLFLCSTIIFINAGCVDSFSDRCSDLVRFDVDEIENHLSKLNLTDVSTVKIMAAGFKCPTSALPFGTLKSDWSRMLLLRDAQPEGSIIKRKLVRLMRILIIAYYQMEEHFEATDSDAMQNKSPMKETKKTALSSAADDTSKLLPSNISWINETFNNNVDPYDSSTTRTDTTTVKNCSSSSVVPFEIRLKYENVTQSPTDLTSNRPENTSLIPRNFTFKILDNCLKQSLNDIARRQPNRGQVFEFLKNKAKYSERAAPRENEIDDYEGYRTRISSPTNEFWRYASAFSTDAPFAKRAYRMWGSNRFRTSLRKSRKRAKSDVNVNENLRQFYGVEKNEAMMKKYTSDRNNIAIEREGKKVTG